MSRLIFCCNVSYISAKARFPSDTTRPAPNPATRDGEVLHELVIPLVSDTAFFQLLSLAIHHISAHMIVLQSNFVNTLHDLSSAIRNSARPASSVSRSFHPFSATSNAATVGVSSGVRGVCIFKTILILHSVAFSIERFVHVERDIPRVYRDRDF